MSVCVLLLAGGMGSRMGADVPKPLVQLGGRPLIEHVLLSLQTIKNVNIEDVIVVTNPTHQSTYQKLNGVTKTVVQMNPQGTFHAVESAFPMLKSYQKVLIVPGDKPFVDPQLLERMMLTPHHTILGYQGINKKPVLETIGNTLILNAKYELVSVIS